MKVQRFVGPEHEKLGNVTGASIDLGNGVILTWGQVVALAGDEYGSVDALIADTKTDAGKKRLRAAMEHDEIPGPNSNALTGPSSDKEAADLKSDEGKRYIDLLLHNVEHFAAGGTAIATWQTQHGEALGQALTAGKNGDAAAQQLALAKEAFAEHFLTDSFSGGHIRTPRAEIINWYTTVFAPKIIDALLANVRTLAINEVFLQVRPQVTSWASDATVRDKVTTGVNRELDKAIATAGGHDKVTQLLGLVIAGAVSGAMHDLEGKRGVWVSSEAHPAPWQAFGDQQLSDSPVSEEQAKKAIMAAKSQVDVAYTTGVSVHRAADVSSVPQTMYFGFDSNKLSPASSSEVAAAAAYMRIHPEAVLELVGHTDPIGSDAFNQGLGNRRATAVAQALQAAGIASGRVTIRSEGEKKLATTNPKQYRLNRRVELTWGIQPGPFISQEDAEASRLLVSAGVAPPYQPVLQYVPHAVEGKNPEMEDWHWGSMPPSFVGEVNGWVKRYAGPEVAGALARPELNDILVDGYTVRPRPIVDKVIKDLLKDPVTYLGKLFGSTPGK